MKMPDKVYVKKEKNNVVYSLSLQRDNGSVEYLRKNIVDETIKTAEDHAYFAGHPDDDVFWGQRNAYKQMKDKLNSL